jgi:parallel beta-helix repeat protein
MKIQMNKLAEVVFAILLVLLDINFVRAKISGEQTSKIIYVNNQDHQASDQNPGTKDLPLKTINNAAGIARQNQASNIGTKIIIYPGTYRERIDLSAHGPTDKDVPMIFEAREKGKVIVSGSDVWNGWKRRKNTDIYTHPWPYKWGLAPYPPGWEGNVVLEPIVRRREMIFVNGKSLDQVLSFEELKEGRFYVSEEEGIVYIWLSPGSDINNTSIEVAIRSGLFYANGKRNIWLKGLTFQHDNTPLDGTAVHFVNSSNLFVEDCQFIWNNWTGLGLSVSQSVSARRNVANHNGGGGMGTYKIKTLLFEDNETSFNNWRGTKGGFFGWAVAGIKNLRIHDGVYRRHKSVGNQTRGFWLDFDNANILIEAASWCDNLTNGIFIEASQGPITIRDSLICHNRKYGIQTTNSSAVTLAGNTIRGNGSSQILVTGDIERPISDWETGEQIRLKVEHWTLQENIIVGEDARQLLLDTPRWGHFLDSLASKSNHWYNPEKSNAFKVGSMYLDFRGWQATMGQDFKSIFAAP